MPWTTLMENHKTSVPCGPQPLCSAEIDYSVHLNQESWALKQGVIRKRITFLPTQGGELVQSSCPQAPTETSVHFTRSSSQPPSSELVPVLAIVILMGKPGAPALLSPVPPSPQKKKLSTSGTPTVQPFTWNNWEPVIVNKHQIYTHLFVRQLSVTCKCHLLVFRSNWTAHQKTCW